MIKNTKNKNPYSNSTQRKNRTCSGKSLIYDRPEYSYIDKMQNILFCITKVILNIIKC